MNEARERIRGYTRRLLNVSCNEVRDLSAVGPAVLAVANELSSIPEAEAEQVLVEAKLPSEVWALLMALYFSESFKDRTVTETIHVPVPQARWLLYTLVEKTVEIGQGLMGEMDASARLKFAKSFDPFKAFEHLAPVDMGKEKRNLN